MFPDSRFGPLVWERSLLARHNDEFLQDFIDRRGLLAEKKAKKSVKKTGLWRFSLTSVKKSNFY